jgi:pimeloyl-ACP methyl ester carboxylesterase
MATYSRSLRRFIGGFLLGLAGIALVAFLVAAAITWVGRSRHAAPGRLIAVGGHRLHVHALGAAAGGPPVVLLAAEGGFSGSWAWVQPEVARFGQAVAYDRAGLAWSEAGAEPADARYAVRQLLALLDGAGIEPPYVLVGHSLGALHARVFAELYPDRVAGMVLIDPPSLQGNRTSEGVLSPPVTGLLPALAAVGLLRLANPAAVLGRGLPQRESADARFFCATVRHASTTAAELRELEPGSTTWTQTAAHAAPGTLGGLPLLVLSRSLPADAGTVAQQAAGVAWSQVSGAGGHWVVPGADHFTLVTERGGARWVVAAVRDVSARARRSR